MEVSINKYAIQIIQHLCFRDQRLAIKSELSIRAKALANSEFPSQAIIDEFLIRPTIMPKLDLKWKQPNVIKFLVLRILSRLCVVTFILCCRIL